MGNTGSSGQGSSHSGLSKAQQDALDDYRTQNYTKFNQLSRGELDKLTDAERKLYERQSKHLDSAMGKLTSTTVLFRGTSLASLGANLKIGSILTDKAHLSTSRHKNVGEGFSRASKSPALLVIRASKGTKAIDVGSRSGHREKERLGEVILARGTKLRVTNVSTSKSGKTVIHADVVQ